MRRLRLGAAVGIPVVLYLLYVFHYAVNVPYSDDWNMIPTVELGAPWAPRHARSVEPVRRHPPLCSPAGLCALRLGRPPQHTAHSLVQRVADGRSYALLLLLLRTYLRRALTFLPVLVVGVVWLSLADVQNSLWSFQVAWYLATFFFVVMIYVLLAPRRFRAIFFGLGIVVRQWRRRTRSFRDSPCGRWVSFASCGTAARFAGRPSRARPGWPRRLITAALYLHAFDTSDSQCGSSAGCGAAYGLRHPYLLVRYVVLLMGNFVPTSSLHPNLAVYGILGTAVFVAAGFVVVQSIRARSTQPSPLPVALIAYGFFFDTMIALGRFGSGPAGALYQNRYTMPNLVLFTGVVVYACAHLPLLGGEQRRVPGEAHRPAHRLGWVAVVGSVALLAFVAVQFSVAAGFAIRQGRAYHRTYETDARFVVNLSGIPSGEQGCGAALAVLPPQSPGVGALQPRRRICRCSEAGS